MLDEADILNLIRLNFIELSRIYGDLDSNSEEDRNNAGEMVLETEELAKKLKSLYEALNSDYEIYPKYEDYVDFLKTKI